VLHDDVLLAIFDFCVAGNENQLVVTKREVEAWQSLVHVCRRWRSLVFESPRRLNLRLFCTPRTPTRETLDVWPALPLIIWRNIFCSTSVDNIVVALGHSDRVCRIDLLVNGDFQWDKVLAAIQVPFPALTDLQLSSHVSHDETVSVTSDTFGGSAPRLRNLRMGRISFPGIPNLLLSATHLVDLYLYHIPHSGYFSPEAMATCLSVLTSLKTLYLDFLSFRSRPNRKSRRPPPMTRSILPDLTRFWFKGVSEYLEVLVAQIDAPRLDKLFITLLYQINFDTPHLVQFISRTPRLEEPNLAMVGFDVDFAEVRLLPCESDDYGELCVKISCEDTDEQLSSMAQVCAMCLPPLPTVENLRVFPRYAYAASDWKDDVENDQWLELLRPFTAVKSLHLSDEFQPGIAFALQELVGGRTAEVLPSLQNIFLARFERSGPFQENIGQFIAARQLSGCPITISVW
jgi:hypothetical protein